jgi:prepilin-type N-terminal cleavage/methylation domain-containing protein
VVTTTLLRLRRDETGFTLPELLIAMMVGLVVLGTAALMFTSSLQGQSGLQSRAFNIQQARATIDRMVREIHQGFPLTTASPNQLTFITYVDRATCGGAPSSTAIQCQVNYTCTAGTCTRMERNINGSGGGTPVQVVSGLSSSNVFTYSPSPSAPTYVGVTLSLSPQGRQTAVTLDDGAALGNVPPS